MQLLLDERFSSRCDWVAFLQLVNLVPDRGRNGLFAVWVVKNVSQRFSADPGTERWIECREVGSVINITRIRLPVVTLHKVLVQHLVRIVEYVHHANAVLL